MKLTTIIILSACLTASVNGYSQKVTISEKNANLEKIFKQIKKQTGYVFFYDVSILDGAKPVTIQVKDVEIEQVLKEILHDQLLDYSIENKTIAIVKKDPSIIKEQTPLPSPPITVRGRIVNDGGEPVQATITAKGTGKAATSTNDKGEFAIVVKDLEGSLIISAVGIEILEIKLDGRRELTINVKTKVSVMDEVQRIAYGTTTRRFSTGSISKIKGEDIRNQPVENPMLALGGRAPGLQITQVNGMAGGAVSISIRGRNSLGAGSEPLYIIDGVPFAHSLSTVVFSNNVTAQTLGGLNNATNGTSPFVTLNAADIESIEVLKDADATAIYGSRGSNGVILITTRKAKANKTSVEASFYTGWGRPTIMPEMLNTQQYVAMRKEAFKNDGIIPTASNATDFMVWDTTRYNDWAKILMGETARSYDAQVRLSGGNEQTRFSLSTGYHRETPVFYGNMFDDRIHVRANMTHHSIDKKFSLTLSTGYNIDNNNINTIDMGQLLTTIPNAPYPLDANGNLVWSDKGVNFSNPLQFTKKLYKGVTEHSISDINLGYRFSKNFEIRIDGGMNIVRLDQRTTNPVSSQSPLGTTPISSAQFFNESQRNWIVEPQAEYTKQFGKGRLQVLAGCSFQEQLTEGATISATGYASDELLGTPGPAATKSVTSNYGKYRYNAFFGRVGYRYNNKYLINISGRRDGSSRFGPGKQFGNFGAVGAGWIFSEEKFMKNISFLNYGKIRTSIGVTGNDRIGNYQYIARWSTTSAALPYQGISGFFPINLQNPDFAWERNQKWEAAIELGFFQDRLFASATYYMSRSDNQLIGYTLPSQTGFASITANRNAIVENRGWEFMINTTNIRTKNFTWKSSFNISIPRSELVAYPNLETSSFANALIIGYPVTVRKYLEYQGVDTATGIYKLNGINLTKDRTQVRDLGQRLYGGLQNTFTYKGWSLDLFFHFVQQDGLSSINFVAPGNRSNQTILVLDRWQHKGEITDIQKFSTTGAAVTQFSLYSNFSSARVVNASFIRLKNVSLSYQFDKKLIEKFKIESLKVYFQGQNLFTFTPYEYGDPETLSYYTLPLRMLSVGIQVIF
ncbi:MAG: SusC/RagA family TonB-linked outer membrane protein [Bacteroidetes bacterium]|nr:MAG: SusC/RagA family TonB-linked outer membrane protein [Bacteroidota bacterium]